MFENGIDQSIHTSKISQPILSSKIGKHSSFFLTACRIESLDSSVRYDSYHPRRVPEKSVTSKLTILG